MNKNSTLEFKLVGEGARMPTRGSQHSVGFDLYAAESRIIIGGQGNVLVPTNVSVRVPAGTYGRVAPRSGLSVKEHICVGAGVIDPDYKGSIGVILYCTKLGHAVTITKGDRIAQFIPERACFDDAIDVGEGEFTHDYDSSRGTGGFGSTGI